MNHRTVNANVILVLSVKSQRVQFNGMRGEMFSQTFKHKTSYIDSNHNEGEINLPELIYDEIEIEKIKRFKRDLEWFKANYEQIKSQYKGQHVAIKDQEIIDSDKDVMVLFQRLKGKYDTSSLVVEYINEHKAEYVL